ncbi:MAG TPA: hypothetical protein VNU97_05400 [Rhizomicrobium sp.]|jgi:hypothetical protein|nr:hypothetical protein [Rhizomicrobium sp.]
MTEQLAIMKSLRQRGIEGWLTLALPPLAAAAARLAAGGWTFRYMPIVVLAYDLPSALGNLSAARFGWGEWATPDERRKRLLDHMLAIGPARAAFWMSLGFTVWMASIFATIVDFHDRQHLLLLSGVALAGGVLAGLMCLVSIRRQKKLYAAADAENWPEQTLRGWLRGYLKIHYPCLVGGAALGLTAGWFLPFPAAIAVLLAGAWGGLLLESVLLNRFRMPKRPLLWTQIGFGGALGLALLRMGIPLAFILGLMPLMLHHPNPLEMVVLGIVGGLFGTVLVLVSWGVAQLGNIGPRQGG